MPWSPAAALWVFLLQLAAVTLFSAGLGEAVTGGALSESIARVLVLPISSVAAALMTLLVVARRHPGHTWRLRGPRTPRMHAVWKGIGYGIGAYLLVNVAFGYLLQAAVTAGGGEMPVVQQVFREFASDRVAAPIFVVGAILFAPIGEELLFRGMLFQSVRARLGTWPGIGLSAVAFGLVHVGPTTSTGGNLVVFTTIFALGMVLAWMFHRSGSIVVPIVAHCTFNAISAALLVATVG